MIIFDGQAFASELMEKLKVSLALARLTHQPSIAAILFKEDKGSQLYTAKKQQAAAKLGFNYLVFEFSMQESLVTIKAKLDQLNQDPQITGIIIQKPWRKTYLDNVINDNQAYQTWWSHLVEMIDTHKDIDGLHPRTLQALQAGTWQAEGRVLPATCAAVWQILQQIPHWAEQAQDWTIIIVGKSDLLGQPLFYLLKNQGYQVEMLGKRELAERSAQGIFLRDADVVVSSTGQAGLITGEMLKPGVALIDVGEPQPDINVASVQDKASFLTPVPGGVGPITVACLMANGVELAKK